LSRPQLFACTCIALLAGCATDGKSPGPDDATADSGEAPAEECAVEGPARSPMRRLTPAELDRTLVDLGLVSALADPPAVRILPPEAVGGFSNNVDVRNVGAETADAYSRLALEVASGLDPAEVLTCPGLFEDVDERAEAEAGRTLEGYLFEDHVGLFSPGWVEVALQTPGSGVFTIEALLRGTPCDGEQAAWLLSVDDVDVADGFATEEWGWVGTAVELDAGSHRVRVSFGNDCYLPDDDEDRNLYVDAFRITASSVPVGDSDDFSACVSTWLSDFLPRVWRRPLDNPDDLARIVELFSSASDRWSHSTALRIVVEVLLQSPRMLYRVEDTVLDASNGQLVALDGYEMASRLSYFLWGTMPDDTLFEAAASGALETPEGLAEQATRMLDDPRAEGVVELFFEEWMSLSELDHVEKDLSVYPDWTDDQPVAFREETLRFVRTVWTEEEASFEALLTAPWTIADAELAAWYGLESGGSDWARVDRDSNHHSGILTQGAFLSSRARSYGSSPIHRGMFIRGAVLCHVIEAPDASIVIEVPDPDPDATTREVLEQHRADPVCASCHDLIDPPGLAFEHFDGIGRFRTHENGLPVDASTELTGTDVNGWIDGAADLGSALVRSTMVHECFSQQWFRFAHGRREADGDTCAIEEAAATFAEEDLDMRSLVIATVSSPAFRNAVGSR